MDQFHNELELDIEFYSILLMGYLKFKKKIKSSGDQKPENVEGKETETISDIIPSKNETNETNSEGNQSDGNSPTESREQGTTSQVIMVNECRYSCATFNIMAGYRNCNN